MEKIENFSLTLDTTSGTMHHKEKHKMRTDSTVKFMFLRDKNRHPMGCLAYEVKSPNTLAFGLSVQNPKDKFDRALGRQIAEGRLKAHPTPFECKATDPHLKEVLEGVLAMLSSSAEELLPRRIRKAIQEKETFTENKGTFLAGG